MEKQKKIKHSIFSAFCYGLFSIVLCLSIVSESEAANIVCGSGNNCLCDTETRQCVKYIYQQCITSPTTGTSTCHDVTGYKCIGKREPLPNRSEVITVSTDASGHVLKPEEEARELRSKHPAEKTDFEKKEVVTEYYKDKDQLDISENVRDILNKTRKKEEDDETMGVDDTEDCLNAIAELSKYTTSAGYDEGMGSPGDSRLLDAYQKARDKLKDVYEDKYISEEDYRIVKEEIDKLYKEAVHRIESAANKAGDTKKEKQVQEELADAVDEYAVAECPTSGQLRARYQAGCWSCLVLEKLTSAFLHAANHGLKVVQKAGLTLLWLGTAIWIVFWGLKNVSSFTQVDLGNILNDLIKFLFKVAVAYWFIVYSPTAISQYFIKPIMSVGAIIAQQFWDTKVKEFTEDYNEAFEPDNPEEAEKVAKKVEENNKKGMGGTNTEAVAPSNEEEDTTGGTGVVEQPKPVQYDSTEAVVQDLQKAFINILRKQLSEIKNSCGGPCGESCRHKSCSNAGHRNYIKSIMQLAGYGAAVDHYCQASITAAMAKLVQAVGAKESVLKKAGASCFGGIGLGAVGDIKLCDKGRQAYQNINVGDTVYYHNVIRKGGSGKKVGGGSGHHAVTYSGSGKTISFNGDSEGSMCNSYYYDVWGKVLCVSCLLREKIKKDPNFVKNTGALSSLAQGVNMTLVNYEGGSFSSVGMADTYTAGTGDINYDDLVVTIPDIKYTGPTNIMPKSVMNSILGATRVITDTTADVMVMGDMIMCYSSAKNGGAWHIDAKILDLGYWTNFVMWIQGGIIWCMGFMLTVSIAYYLVDISFKIGFAVLAIPVMMGLWPFGFTQGKIFIAISIIAKSAATFAFLALTTAFGMGLVGEAVGGLEELYGSMDALTQGETEEESIRSRVSDTLYLFSPTFVLLIFAILYFYKMVQQTISDLVNKFFPDQAFGDSSPMHSGATMATSFAKRFAMSASGFNLAKDIVAHQTGRLVKGGLKRAGAAASYPIRHPMKSTRAAVHAIAHPVKTGKAAVNATVKGAKAVGNATVNGAKAVGNAIRHPVKTGKKALNATGRGIKKGWNRASGKE